MFELSWYSLRLAPVTKPDRNEKTANRKINATLRLVLRRSGLRLGGLPMILVFESVSPSLSPCCIA